jgi:hypothetical protein
MTNSLKEKLLENLKQLAKEALIQTESYNYMANFWTNWYLYIGILNTVLASVASISALLEALGRLSAAILTASVAVLSAITTFLNPADRSSQHKKAKDRFVAINIEARKVAIDAYSVDSDELLKQLKEKVDTLSVDMVEALQTSPQIPEWVCRVAEKRAERKFKF